MMIHDVLKGEEGGRAGCFSYKLVFFNIER